LNKILIAVVGVVLTLASMFSVRSEPLTYEIEFVPRGSLADTPLTMFCTERGQCRGEIELHIGGTVQPATIDPLFMPDHVLILFGAPNMPLTINGQKSIDVPLDSSHAGHLRLTVRGPALPKEKGPAEDLVARFIVWPVKVFTKTIDVYIQPSH
jgi:hypothetical protein